MKTRNFALKLLDWHGGQGSGLYAVGSTLYGGQREPDLASVSRAVDELENMKQNARYPDSVMPHDEAECNRLATQLRRMYPDAFRKEAERE